MKPSISTNITTPSQITKPALLENIVAENILAKSNIEQEQEFQSLAQEQEFENTALDRIAKSEEGEM